MAELLVRVVDKVSDDPYLDAKLTKRGDVIAVCPDGWVWSTIEQTNAAWRIVKLPGLTTAHCAGFLAPELDIDPQNPSKVLQRRAFKLDVDNLPTTSNGAMADHTRVRRFARSNLSAAELATFKLAKPPLQDPNVL